MKKIIIIFIIMLLITITIPVTGIIKEKNQFYANHFETQNTIPNTIYISETSNNLDQLDQYYTNDVNTLNIEDVPIAQTFKPSYQTITRIEILLDKEGQNTEYSHLAIKLKGGLPGGNGNIIWGTVINNYNLNTGINWHEIDIVDNSVLPGATYHILIYGITKTEYVNNVGWRYGWEETYTNGDAYYYINSEWSILQYDGSPCDFCFKTYGTDFGGNHGPNIPDTPSGPSTVKIGETYTYSTSSTDPDGDQISYGFDWDGDRVIDDNSGMLDSGTPCFISHNWSNTGSYQIRVKSYDSHGRESDWSDPLSVTVSKSKSYIPFGLIFVFGFDVDVKIVQLEPDEDYVDLEVLSKQFYIWENEMTTRNPGEFIRLYNAKGLFTPSLPMCFGICDDWGIIG